MTGLSSPAELTITVSVALAGAAGAAAADVPAMRASAAVPATASRPVVRRAEPSRKRALQAAVLFLPILSTSPRAI